MSSDMADARDAWTNGLMDLFTEKIIAEIRMLLLYAIDATEQTGVESALRLALAAFDQEVLKNEDVQWRIAWEKKYGKKS